MNRDDLKTVFQAEGTTIKSCVSAMIEAAISAGDGEASQAAGQTIAILNQFMASRGWWGPKIHTPVQQQPAPSDRKVVSLTPRQRLGAEPEGCS